jgi:hypothetical protein
VSDPEPPTSESDAVTDALARIHTLAETLIVRVVRDRIERAELIDALSTIANDAESCMLAHDVVPF